MTISNTSKASRKNWLAGFRSARAQPAKQSKRRSRNPAPPAVANKLPVGAANQAREIQTLIDPGGWCNFLKAAAGAGRLKLPPAIPPKAVPRKIRADARPLLRLRRLTPPAHHPC